MTTGLENTGCTGTLQIGTVVLSCPAWDITDLTPLWVETTVRGGDRLIPGAAGVRPFRRRVTVTTHALPMLISGDVDPLGVVNTDAWVGLEENLADLWTNVVAPTNTGDGTRAAILTMPSGATRTANVHVLGLRVGSTRGEPHRHHAVVRASLQISIPAGRFA